MPIGVVLSRFSYQLFLLLLKSVALKTDDGPLPKRSNSVVIVVVVVMVMLSMDKTYLSLR